MPKILKIVGVLLLGILAVLFFYDRALEDSVN